MCLPQRGSRTTSSGTCSPSAGCVIKGRFPGRETSLNNGSDLLVRSAHMNIAAVTRRSGADIAD